MKKPILITLIICILLIVSACSRVNNPSNTATETPAPPASPTLQTGAISGGPASSQTPAPKGTAVYPVLDQCNLLDSRDLASLFSSAEVVLPQAQVSQVDHVIFSAEKTPTSESECVYYAYHRPGQKEMEMLQVSYWVDIPRQATPAAWAQVWKDASSNGVQAVSGVGDGAFFENGRLTFKKNGTYVTIEAIGTYLNSGTSTVGDQQVQIEKQLALDVLSRFG
jgi:hypothetical protein